MTYPSRWQCTAHRLWKWSVMWHLHGRPLARCRLGSLQWLYSPRAMLCARRPLLPSIRCPPQPLRPVPRSCKRREEESEKWPRWQGGVRRHRWLHSRPARQALPAPSRRSHTGRWTCSARNRAACAYADASCWRCVFVSTELSCLQDNSRVLFLKLNVHPSLLHLPNVGTCHGTKPVGCVAHGLRRAIGTRCNTCISTLVYNTSLPAAS